jgi:hypothetical protein
MTELASGRGQPRPRAPVPEPGDPPASPSALSRVPSVHMRVVVRLCFTCASRTRGADMEEEWDPVSLVGRAGVATSRIPFDEEPGVRPGVAVGLQ